MLAAIVESTRRIRRKIASILSRRGNSLSSDQRTCDCAYPQNVYGELIPWEVPVQLCLRDVLREGDCALDVGANIGGLATAMSRMVGASGSIYAFEANPKTLPRLRADLAANGASNVTVVPKAAWSVSGESISFYCDNSYYAAASSVHRRDESWQEVRVPTISLDDYCRINRLAPKAIKLDVEGAEYDVLTGAQWILEQYAPSVVMEYYPAATREKDPVELLRSRGYAIFDTNLYRRVDRDFYLNNFEKPPMSNVFAVSPASAAHKRYGGLSLDEIQSASVRGGATKWLALHQPGRFLVAADLDGPDSVDAGLRVIDFEARSLAYFQAPIRQLKEHSCSHLVIEVDRPCQIRCELSSEASTNIALRSVKVTRVVFANAA